MKHGQQVEMLLRKWWECQVGKQEVAASQGAPCAPHESREQEEQDSRDLPGTTATLHKQGMGSSHGDGL